jgi:cobalt-zinc-cadmium resistance protein CzcA
VILSAAREVAKPIFFRVVIIVVVYVPILTLGGVEGKMFKAMAAAVLFALLASLVIALTLMPVLSWYVLRNRVAEKQTWLMRKMDQWYRPLLQRALHHPAWTGGNRFRYFRGIADRHSVSRRRVYSFNYRSHYRSVLQNQEIAFAA